MEGNDFMLAHYVKIFDMQIARLVMSCQTNKLASEETLLRLTLCNQFLMHACSSS
jgi:hypothetical protein